MPPYVPRPPGIEGGDAKGPRHVAGSSHGDQKRIPGSAPPETHLGVLARFGAWTQLLTKAAFHPYDVAEQGAAS